MSLSLFKNMPFCIRDYFYNSNSNFTRRVFVTTGFIGLLTGCSQSLTSAFRSANLVFGGDNQPVDIAKYRALPYASMTAKLGISPTAVVVLGQINGNELYWFTSDKTALVTRRGRLIRTIGLPENLSKTIYLDSDAFQGIGVNRRLVDVERGGYFGVRIDGELYDLGDEIVELYGQQPIEVAEAYSARRKLRHWREVCHATSLDWEFTNDYWVNLDNRQIWKSIQHYLPGMPPIELSILKPFAGSVDIA